jgi:hypothetical protein
MSDAVIYFGAPVKGKKAVPSEIRAIGQELLPVAPSQVVVDVANEYTQPNHAIFTRALSLFVVAAHSKKTISLNESIYQTIDHTHIPDFHKIPKLIWSYSYNLSPQQKEDVKNKFEAEETEAFGKPAFTRIWKDQTWWTELKKETSLNLHTPTNSTNMNVASFRHYIILLRILDQIMRVSQYAAFKDNTPPADKRKCYQVFSDTETDTKVDMDQATTIAQVHKCMGLRVMMLILLRRQRTNSRPNRRN